jgi:hypothetical protein
MGLVGGVDSRGRGSELLLGRWSRRLIVDGQAEAAFGAEGEHYFRERADFAAGAGAANTASGSPDDQALEGSCPVLGSPRETP